MLMRNVFMAACIAAAPLGAQVVAITGGTVHPVSGPKIEHGTVIIRDGKIAAVGANLAVPAGATVIDATGKIVTPGLINANSTLGLSEAGGPQFSGGYNDTRAKGSQGVAAAVRAWEGVNPASTYILPGRQGGVTSALVTANGGLISGQAGFIDLSGDKLDDMLVRRSNGSVAVAMGASFSPGDAGTSSRSELLARVRELLDDARAYRANKANFERNASRSFSASRGDLDALQQVIDSTIPLAVEVHRASDILTLLQLKRESPVPLKLVLVGASEGWMVAKEIAAAKVPVLVGAMSNIPVSFDQLGARQENAALLRAAGVAVTLISNGPSQGDAYNVDQVRQEAGNAVAYGLTWDEALRAITLAPAEAFGVADKIGSLRAGREANVVIWDGDPFEFSTRAVTVLIRGVVQTGVSRREMLTQRYMR